MLELAATSELQRIRWVHALGESVCSTPSPFTTTSPQPRARVTQPSAHGADFEDGGRVRLLQRRVADTYNMGKLIVHKSARAHQWPTGPFTADSSTLVG